MKDRTHDAGMAELFREDPDFATQYLNSVLEEGDQADLLIALRQMAQAFGVGAFTSLEDQVRRNMEMFERAFAMFAPFARREGAAAEAPEPEKPPARSGDFDDLRRQLDEMKRKVDKLTEKEPGAQ